MAATHQATQIGADALRARLVSRLALRLVCDLIDCARVDRNVLDTLIGGAIIQANIAEIGRHADLQVAFAETNDIPPNEMRRPVSMNALANSLQLPFETVRRRTKAMATEGFCRFVEGGVIVPAEALTDPKYFAGALRAYERIREFYFDLFDQGLLTELPRPSVDLAGNAFPMRAVSRIMGAYVLRVTEALGAAGDMTDGIIWLEMLRANQAGLTGDIAAEAALGEGAAVDDARLAPVSISALAAGLGLPNETVRRRAVDMAARGVCARARKGWIVPGAALEGAELAAIPATNVTNLMRVLGALSQLGVLALWDQSRPIVAASAAARG